MIFGAILRLISFVRIPIFCIISRGYFGLALVTNNNNDTPSDEQNGTNHTNGNIHSHILGPKLLLIDRHFFRIQGYSWFVSSNGQGWASCRSSGSCGRRWFINVNRNDIWNRTSISRLINGYEAIIKDFIWPWNSYSATLFGPVVQRLGRKGIMNQDAFFSEGSIVD